MPPQMSSRRPVVHGIQLEPEMSPEQFLEVVIFDDETTARFVLDWASADVTAAAGYLARFLAKVHRELITDISIKGASYLPPRPGIETTFGRERQSVSYVALRRFYELLFESPALVALVQANPEYARTLGDSDFFADREHKHFTLGRGSSWDPTKDRFADSKPIAESVRIAHLQRQEEPSRAYERIRAKEVEDNKARVLAKKDARRRAIEPKLIEESKRSAEHKAFREQISAMSLLEQARRLAWDETYSIRVFPIDPDTITLEVLREIDSDTRAQLLSRISARWEKYWKHLAHRIQVAQEEHNQSQ